MQLAARIRSGELTAHRVVAAHIEEVRRVNPALNAVVAERFEAALAEAEAADRQIGEWRSRRDRARNPHGHGDRRSAGQRTDGGSVAADPAAPPPLLGVPCTIKESFALTGMPNSAGLVARRDLRATEDAPAVARLRAAGAIPLGVTNTSELCMWLESSNKIYGRTNNPHDLRCHVGGSSGGEGAIIAAGGSPFGLGADIGGSIRMPAFFNGVYGHKPSPGLVPNAGQFPLAHGRASRFLATGPLCRRAEDLWPLLQLLQGRGEEFARLVVAAEAGGGEVGGNCRTLSLRAAAAPGSLPPHRLRLLVIPGFQSPLVSRPRGGVLLGLARAVSILAARGARLEHPHLPELRHAFDIWSAALGQAEGRDRFRREMQRPRARDLWLQLSLALVGRSPHTWPALALGLGENSTFWSRRRLAGMLRAGRALRARLLDLLGDDGVLLFPPHPLQSVRHGLPLLTPFNCGYTAFVNAIGFCATQVPLGPANGLPTGVQVIGPPGADARTIAVAELLAEVTEGSNNER
jgi:fatty acid amide hydrolase 2